MENGESTEVILLIVAGCLGMAILVVFIILFVIYYQKKVLAQQNQMQLAENKYQRQLLSAAIEVEENERERIAKNVHDDLGLLLQITKINEEKILRNSDKKELIQNLGTENIQMLEESIQIMRGVAKDLVPPTLRKLGFIGAMNELCRQVNKENQIAVSFTKDDPELRLPEQTELQLYRLTKELMNNVIKHTEATELSIEFKQHNSFYNLTLVHNGKGITSVEVKELSKEGKGLGLKSIQSRAQLINADVQYQVQNNSASIHVILPF